jgi:Ca-dependent carbohydrate-binding module xylan-binding
MRKNLVPFTIGAALVLVWSLQLAVAGGQDKVTVSLKDFKFKVPAEKESLFGYNDGEEKLFFYTNGTAEAKVKVPADGDYEITVKASGDPALKERAKFKLAIDAKEVGKETELTSDDPKEYKFTAALKAGEPKVTIEYTNDVYKENEYDRNLYIHGVSLKKVK